MKNQYFEEPELDLENLSKLKSEMLSRTSHELKTPLMQIKGYADLLFYKFNSTLQDADLFLIKQIREGCKRLEFLINNILYRAELKSTERKIEREHHDLSSLLKLCTRYLEGFVKLRGHELKLNIHDSLIISFDKEQITHVINNIITNAIKYTPLNGVIEITSKIDENFIIIEVKDNGIGISEEDKEILFTRFGRIKPEEQRFDIITEGSGLGLHIAKKVIDLHGGKIWVESEGKNKGSTFFFSLPIIKN